MSSDGVNTNLVYNLLHMNIVVFTHYFHPHVGGIETVAAQQSKHLSENGHEVTVVTTDIGADIRRTSRDGYEVRRYAARNPFEGHGIPYPLPNPVDCARITRSVVDEKTDIVHVHGLNYLTSLLPLLAIRDKGVPTVLHQHTPFVEYAGVLDYLEMVNDRCVGGAVVHHADRCIAVSDNIAEYLNEIGGGSVRTLYNGVDTDRFNPDHAETVNEYLYVGRVTQKKGIRRLLRTAERLEWSECDTTIRVVGKGDLADEVRKVAETTDILEFEGFVSAERLPALYSQARALLVPKQLNDAFPTLTILEALASGTPPILASEGQHPSMFVEGKNYFKADPTAESIADVIRSLSNEPDRLNEASNEARITAERHFSWETNVTQLEDVYRDVQQSAD